MSSYAHLSLDSHLHALQPDHRDHLRRSRLAAERYALLQAVRAQRSGHRPGHRAARRPIRGLIARLLPVRTGTKQTTSPA